MTRRRTRGPPLHEGWRAELSFVHQPVLLNEAVELLSPGPGKVIVDGTLGGGGHTEALLERGAFVLGIDRDPRARKAAPEAVSRFGADRFRAVKGNCSEVEQILAREQLAPIDGLLLDLGISSP